MHVVSPPVPLPSTTCASLSAHLAVSHSTSTITQARSLFTSAAACAWETFNCASVSLCCWRLSIRSQTKISTSAIPSNQMATDSYVLSQGENVSHMPERISEVLYAVLLLYT